MHTQFLTEENRDPKVSIRLTAILEPQSTWWTSLPLTGDTKYVPLWQSQGFPVWWAGISLVSWGFQILHWVRWASPEPAKAAAPMSRIIPVGEAEAQYSGVEHYLEKWLSLSPCCGKYFRSLAGTRIGVFSSWGKTHPNRAVRRGSGPLWPSQWILPSDPDRTVGNGWGPLFLKRE